MLQTQFSPTSCGTNFNHHSGGRSTAIDRTQRRELRGAMKLPSIHATPENMPRRPAAAKSIAREEDPPNHHLPSLSKIYPPHLPRHSETYSCPPCPRLVLPRRTLPHSIGPPTPPRRVDPQALPLLPELRFHSDPRSDLASPGVVEPPRFAAHCAPRKIVVNKKAVVFDRRGEEKERS